MKSRTLPLSKRGFNFEMFMWLFTRLSALAIYGLILIAVIGALIMGTRDQMNLADVLRWGFMPTNAHVQGTDVPDLAPWSTPFWRVTGSLLLLLAVAHGAHRIVDPVLNAACVQAIVVVMAAAVGPPSLTLATSSSLCARCAFRKMPPPESPEQT